MRQHPDHLPAGRFFGCNEHLVQQGGFTLSEVSYAPGQKVPPHGHQLAYFSLLVDGGYWEQYGRRRVSYAPHWIVFHPPGDEHYGDISPVGGRCFNIEIASRWIERAGEHGRIPAQPVVFEGGELPWLATRLQRQLQAGSSGLPLLIEGLGLEMLGSLLQEGGSRRGQAPRWLRQAVDRLHDEMDRPLRLEAIAAELDVSPIRLSRAFRRFYGQSLGDYSRRIRIEQACRRLSDPSARLVEVALETGFADQSHFTRVFKRYTGMTPGRYRRGEGRFHAEAQSRREAEEKRSKN